ncbi:MAG TPA: ATP-binding protein [Candidatus Melainabacteria bacterium]|nr:ATP-binding protein [Candidatus Melainabacteria bacterium]HIN63487.1 ATP-binding protein [Candidatus Obscuribacterales bacterium]
MLETKNSAKLFKQFKVGGISFLKSLKDGKATESEILDFKLAKNSQPPLETEDKSNFSKAISGFSNTAGGVLAWGIYCAKDGKGEDCVLDCRPIDNVSVIKTEAEQFLSQCSSPAVQGVEFHCVFENESKASGYLIMHIPKSAVLIESVFKKNKGFYERSGTSFVEMSAQRLVAKAKHKPFSKVLAPYLRFTAFYIGILISLLIGVILGVAVTNEASYQRGFAAGRQEARSEKSKEASGEARPASKRNLP